MESIKKTALYDMHKKYGGKIVEFAGWELPVQYEGIIEEHEAVRNAAGLFDVSHMGEIEIIGNDACDYVQNLVTNDIKYMENNQILYTLMCYPDGGVVDDLLIYKFSDSHFFLVVNAANKDKDYKWMLDNRGRFDMSIMDISDTLSEVALQGPYAEIILQKICEEDLSKIKFFYCKRNVSISGVSCLISRTGYTGEDGFEIYVENSKAESVWEGIIKAGQEYGIKPSGLGCRDTLRFEACLPLYGNEISKSITPLEAGLGYFVKLGKEGFIGREALIKQKADGLKRKLIGLEMVDRGIPRHGYEVMAGEENIGFITTGYFSPTLKKNIGLAMVDINHSQLGAFLDVVVRNRRLKALVVDKKFYKKRYKKEEL